MVKKHTFTAEVHSGNKFKFDSPEKWQETLQKLDGEKVFVTIGKWYTNRSTQQNRYYWGVVVKELCSFTGFEPDEIHDYIKAKFNSENAILISPNEKDAAKSITRIKSTASLSTVEFEELMTKTRNWAAKALSVYIPAPNECTGIYEEFHYDIK